MTAIISMAQTLFASYNQLTDKQCLSAIETIYKSSLRLEKFDDNIANLSKLNKAGYEIKREQIDLSQLIYDRVETCRKLYEENDQDREYIFDIEENIIINGDR